MSVSSKWRRTATALAGIFSLFATMVFEVPVANAATGAHQVAVLGCLSQRLVRPATYNLGCGSGTYVITNASWTDWGSTGARGTGNYVVNTCSPNCAADVNDSYSASFVVHNIKSTAGGPVYKTITIRYLQGGKYVRVTWALPPFST